MAAVTMTVVAAGMVSGESGAAPDGTSAAASAPSLGQWPSAGQNLHNTRSNPHEQTISTDNVDTLEPEWTVRTTGNVTSTPTVFGDMVYFSDQGGTMWGVEADTGDVVWSERVSELTGVPNDVSRPSPAVSGNKIITGNGWINGPNLSGGAQVFAVNRLTGDLIWSTRVHDHPASMITTAPVVSRGVVYTGVAAKEEPLASNPEYECCTFRGAIVAMDERTGKILWKTHTVPSNNGGSDINLPGFYSGNAVWGSSPVIDERRGLLYVGTGNEYTVPEGVCTEPGQTDCEPADPDSHLDSILALRLSDGSIEWATRTLDADVFSGACIGLPECGPDFDFGSGPQLFTTTDPATGERRQLVGIGQKSGIYWALDPDTGEVVWSTSVGPGSFIGGIQWGSATDGERIYVAEANGARQPYTLGGSGPFAGQTTTGGSWAALDPATGEILWQTPDPQTERNGGYVTAASGVVYAGSVAATGNNMFALDAATGEVLWGFDADGRIISGPAVVDGTVYWGSGYMLGAGGNANTFYAFAPTGAGS